MNEDFWYIEERETNGKWLSAGAGFQWGKDRALEYMEKRKREYPRAALRLVHCTKERFTYARRKTA